VTEENKNTAVAEETDLINEATKLPKTNGGALFDAQQTTVVRRPFDAFGPASGGM
jgi:hypothetical protein